MHANLLLADVITRSATTTPSAAAIIEGERTLTWTELRDRLFRLVAVFGQHGVAEGDRLAVMSPNTIGFLEVLFAASLTGVAVVPLNTRLMPSEVRFQADDSGARFAVIHPDFSAVASEAGLDELATFELGSALDAEIDAASMDPPRQRPSDDSVLIQLYTSGTTGRPKGCLLTQRAWLAATASLAHHFGTASTDAVMTSLPFFHVGGLGFALHGLTVGAPLILPSAGNTLAEIERHRVTIAGIPFDLAALGRHPDAARIGASLRAIMGHPGARSIPALPAVRVWNGYGLTESCGLTVMARTGAQPLRDGLLGRPLLHVEVAIVDDDGRLLDPGQSGEIVMRTPSATIGYWELPEATAETLAGGWLHTGDLGRIGDDGQLYFLDRAKDMVKPGGENVYCVEVENVLLRHPRVFDCAVIGVPDKRWGEAVKALVVPKRGEGGADVSIDELDAWCLEHLAPYKRPRWYEYIEFLPRNVTGKVVKHDLRVAHDPEHAIRLAERS
jgi:acyl-CoA synthetase (AMP-forming)/AMP-acid ligase II